MKVIEKESDPFFFTGVAHVLIVGTGQVRLLKSIDGRKSFYPDTDQYGAEVVFYSHEDNGVIYNSELQNTCQQVHYKIEVLEGTAKYMVTV